MNAKRGTYIDPFSREPCEDPNCLACNSLFDFIEDLEYNIQGLEEPGYSSVIQKIVPSLYYDELTQRINEKLMLSKCCHCKIHEEDHKTLFKEYTNFRNQGLENPIKILTEYDIDFSYGGIP